MGDLFDMNMNVAPKQVLRTIISAATICLVLVWTGNVADASRKRTGEVYLIRGLLNVFSLGMDDLGQQAKARGYTTRVFNHTGWKGIARDIIRRSKQKAVSHPIVISGHSLGANSATSMANYLSQNGVKVELVVPFDPTSQRVVEGNIKMVVNYYIPNGAANTVVGSSNFRGKIINVNVSDMRGVGHMNVEKSRKLHSEFFKRLKRISR